MHVGCLTGGGRRGTTYIGRVQAHRQLRTVASRQSVAVRADVDDVKAARPTAFEVVAYLHRRADVERDSARCRHVAGLLNGGGFGLDTGAASHAHGSPSTRTFCPGRGSSYANAAVLTASHRRRRGGTDTQFGRATTRIGGRRRRQTGRNGSCGRGGKS